MLSIKNPWNKTKEGVLKGLKVDPLIGLSGEESNQRMHDYGPNKLVEHKKITFLGVLRKEITEAMILLLFVVGILYSIFGNIGDAITIFVIITVLVFVEIFNEYRAKKTIASLKQLAELTTPVIREGTYQEIKPIDLVPGDIILLKMGQKVPADARLLDSYGLQVDESMLTGESVPILKNADIILTETEELMERINIIFTGTTITRGKGKAVVICTGINTELGKIAGITQAIKEPKTPLQLAMKQLSKWLVFVAIFFCILIPIIGILQRRDLIQMILIGLSLSFATIPEELPIIITIVLALGAFTLSRKKVLVKNLNTAETLGCVTVIATDKTGTLTENKMKLTKIYSNETISDINSIDLSLNARFLLEIGTLVNDIIIKKINEDVSYIGDPMEIAIIEAAELNGISFTSLNKEYVLKNEYSFDNQRMMMSQIHSKDNKLFLFSKGAAENVLNRSSRIKIDNAIKDLNQENKQKILNSVEKITAEGLRVIGFAYNDLNVADLPQEDAEKNLIFVGLAAFFDPPRKEVKDAILASKKAGIRIIMITGDYETTAKNIAKRVGIDADKAITGRELENMTDEKLKEVVKNVSVFARTTPEHKLRIVKALQENGERVAVTGDGINDAPALKMADIGIAMGQTGTDVARESSDMVLLDDNFATITLAIEQGRKLYDNLKKGVRYYLACKIALVVIFLIPLLLNVPLPFAPIQIILLELFMDLAASASFVVETSESDVMAKKPRDPGEKFIDVKMQLGIILGGISLIIAVLSVYFMSYYQGQAQAQTMAFATWMIGHIFLAFNMRTERDSLFKIGLFSNKIIVLWAFLAVLFIITIIYIPIFQVAFKVIPLTIGNWLLILGIAFISTFWMELLKILFKKRK